MLTSLKKVVLKEKDGYEEQHASDSPLTTKSFVIIISLVTGLHEFASLAAFMYQKETLLLSPEIMQMAFAFIAIPWCIKPVFGYIIDKLLRVIRYTKVAVITAEAIRMCVLTIIVHHDVGMYTFYILLFITSLCSLCENIISEYILVKSSKRENEVEGKSNANHLPIFFGFRALGSLIANFFGGRMVHHYGIKPTFFVVSFFPLIVIIAGFFYRELPMKMMSNSTSFQHEVDIMKRLLFRDKVLQMMLFVCLINLTPSFDVLSTFYMTDRLGFTTEDLANFATVSTIAYIVGLLCYSYYMMDIDPRKFFISTNFVYWIINVSFMLVVTDSLSRWGLNNRFFCMLNYGTAAFVSEINGMPILAIWCSICPKNLEATSITLFTGLMNLSGNLSNYFGVLIMWITGINKNTLNKVWILIAIQNVYLLVACVAILFVKFPNPNQIDLESEKIELKKTTSQEPSEID